MKPTPTEQNPSRRPTRSEVDDSPRNPRQPSSKRGGFESDRGADDPGGTAGEHSGQKQEK
jgi:hypothetical protein